LGGTVVQRLWTPGDTKDYRPVVARIRSTGVDGVFLPGGYGGTQTFMAAWQKRHPNLGQHLVLGAVPLTVDPLTPNLVGVVGASEVPWAPTPAWMRYLANLKATFGLRTNLIDTPYYVATEALAEALTQVNGDVSHGERRLQSSLARLRLQTPMGVRTLDRDHQAVGSVYLGRVARGVGGNSYVKQFRVIRGVEHTYGGQFSASSPPSSDTQPVCRKGDVPHWAKR